MDAKQPKTMRAVAVLALAVIASLTPQSAQAVNLTSAYQYSCAADEANCCFGTEWTNKYGGFRCEPDEDGTYPCAVKIGASSWTGSFVNLFVAKVFIEEFLGYPVETNATIVNFTDYSGTEMEQGTYASNGTLLEAGYWEKMDEGILDVCLEYWPSGHAENVQKFVVEDGTVVSGGQNGLEGRIGWYIPSWMTQGQDNVTLEYWRNLNTSSNTELFKDSDSQRYCCLSDISTMSADRLPCMGSVVDGGNPNSEILNSTYCDAAPDTKIDTYGGRFLGGLVDWSQHDYSIIQQNELYLSVEYSGSEYNSVQAIYDSFENETPLLMYFWKPHGIFQEYDLTYVLLPVSSPECVTDETYGNASCGYEGDYLAKAYSAAFSSDKPDAATFVNSFSYSANSQQEAMLWAFMNTSASLLEITCNWIKENNSTWSDWVEAVEDDYSGEMWMDETLEASMIACPCKSDGTRDVVALYNNSAYLDDGAVTIDVDPSYCTDERSYSTYKSRWTTKQFNTTVVEVIDCAYVPSDSSERAVIVALCVIACVVFMLLLIGMAVYRTHAAVRTARHKTLSLLLFGSTLLNISCVFEIGVPEPYKCGLRFTFMLYGFFIFVGTLLIKQFTIVALMNSKYMLNKRQTKNATFFLRYEITTALLFCTAWFIIWYFVAGFTPETEIADSEYNVTETICPSNNIVLMLIICICYLTVVISCVTANQTRNFKGLIFREAKFMLFSNYNVAILTAFCLFVVFTDGISPVLKALFVSVCVFFCTVSCALLVVGTRLYAAWRNLPVDVIVNTSSLVANSSEHASSSHAIVNVPL
mmetsp:Transcript_925/g.2155  ORF Transcript_925/g.2155 Transcript_925/m.2155 type:complete len:811 (-) Transcript_925:167-2599(-)|eukprot:CAMPEP_0171494788 /NCGR_PEP_ID=MMETSP0958-20121227/5755_1 /TAXON_ID=87120 /ORGANISM="Aurantiochytrium limacinum, Strain ATCCMYA-1381" /LENGTH=810 /DNA_ID=CAMNT_0012028647 /DNA_START=374 /DNA_END=2806 /DNA_ORIENTATION=-